MHWNALCLCTTVEHKHMLTILGIIHYLVCESEVRECVWHINTVFWQFYI